MQPENIAAPAHVAAAQTPDAVTAPVQNAEATPAPEQNADGTADAAAIRRQELLTTTMPAEGAYTDFIRRTSDYKEPLPEELAKEQKREKAKARIFAVTDAMNAIGELVWASKGAARTEMPNLSAANTKRYQERLAQRRQQRDAYLAKLEKAGAADIAMTEAARLKREEREHRIEIENRRAEAAARRQRQADLKFGQNSPAARRVLRDISDQNYGDELWDSNDTMTLYDQ